MYLVDTLVLAGSYKEFLSWQQKNGVQRDKCLYIPDERAIKDIEAAQRRMLAVAQKMMDDGVIEREST